VTRIPGMNLDESKPPADDEPRTMSLMSGVAGGGGIGEPDLAVEDTGRRGGNLLSHSGMIIAIVAVLAAGSLYAMRITQGDLTGSTSRDVEQKIENAIIKLSRPGSMAANDPLRAENRASLFQDTDAILAMFAGDRGDHQVPVEYVQKNPFVLPTTQQAAGPVDNSMRDRQRRLDALNQELSRLNLQTVMLGARNVAVINGEFHQPGGTVGSFTIESMDATSVQLIAEGERFVLRIDDPTRRPNRR
jgi:hypothetical protein